ncbi:MAG TPA: Na+/H+ antiporter [Chryseosolibacter sp.]|nr:Na+/H+ antiporter [Chryseosolibacter sp.]
MSNLSVILIIFAVLLALQTIADKIKLPNAVLLVIVGVSLWFIPGLPSVELNPDVVFLLFLPPILYDAASHTSWHDFRSEIRPISTLAITLVFLTTTAVAIACYHLIPGFSWPLAFVLGAIVSPPDAVAATSIIKGMGLNKKVLTILEGESLVNDASALIAYRFSIAAIGTGSFIFLDAGVDFLILIFGGVLIGVAMGFIFILLHRMLRNNSIIGTSLTLLAPFVAYLTAEHFHTSGVLAVVSTGLMISWRSSEIFSYETRIRNSAVWDTVIFLLNGFIFILIGLKLPSIFDDLGDYKMNDLILYGGVVAGVTIAVRLAWVFGASYSFFRTKHSADDGDTWKNVLIVGWTGTRGVVSLATALALPLTLANGTAFPQRSMILFLAFGVIFVTLVIQGLSLPILIWLLKVKSHQHAEEERDLRLLLATNVISFIDHELSDTINDNIKSQVRKPYTELSRRLSKELKDKASTDRVVYPSSEGSSLISAKKEIHQFQRQLLINFHKTGTFDQSTIRRLEQELDYEELQLNRMITRKK